MDQIYWNRYEAVATVSQLNPDISEVKVTTIIAGKEPFIRTLKPDSKYMLSVKCPNIDCSSGYIDLSDEVFNAIKSGNTIEGRKKCSGHLKKYAHNPSPAFNCETSVTYRIEPVKD